jgi:hypothetical protein
MRHGSVLIMPVFFVTALFLFSCESMPINYSRTQSWRLADRKILGTVILLGVSVDRVGGLDSLEKEVAGLAPLCFWEAGCRIITGKPADYAADIQLREREYTLGWRTKRSLLVEVRFWPYGDGAFDSSAYTQTLPLAAGRVISTGDYTLSSFETTNRMLSRAIQKAARQLAARKRST